MLHQHIHTVGDFGDLAVSEHGVGVEVHGGGETGGRGKRTARGADLALGGLDREQGLRHSGARLEYVSDRGDSNAPAVLRGGEVDALFLEGGALGLEQCPEPDIVVIRAGGAKHHVGDDGVVSPVGGEQRLARLADRPSSSAEVKEQPTEPDARDIEHLLH